MFLSKKFLIFLVSFAIFFGFAISYVHAQVDLQNPGETIRRLEEGGIVPCGTSWTGAECELCHLFILAQNITAFIMAFALVISGAFIAYGGLMIILGSYSEEKVKQGKGILTSAIIGTLITLFAWMIVDTSIKALRGLDAFELPSGTGVGLATWGPWNAIECRLNQ